MVVVGTTSCMAFLCQDSAFFAAGITDTMMFDGKQEETPYNHAKPWRYFCLLYINPQHRDETLWHLIRQYRYKIQQDNTVASVHTAKPSH